ncbi:MAG: D-alanyl-D-alanine carboxypeptidase family protein [Eubacteriales bacterium]|nr:D-alanyl-D-alanine carboxypeptidase family protein [Eubacteriales bacterium]
MKCTSKKVLALLAALTVAVSASGCGEETFAFSYDPDYSVSSFRVVGESSFETADAFASGLCVVNGDVAVDDSVVDMSEATAAGLFDLNRHTVLYAKNIHERLAPASLTKLMTAVVALKNGNPDDVITVSANVNNLESGAVVCGLKEGDRLTLNQALHALLIKSANDAAIAIAEHIGGSVEGFAELMNEEAARIGATNSHFVNPHGLTADDHYVTAYDMYLIFNEAINYSVINDIIRMTSYETVYTDKNGAEKKLSFTNSNQYLAGNYTPPETVSVVGGKTGTTNAAGNCLILLAKDTAGNPYIAVILRSKERAILYEEMSGLLGQIGA